jgi:hypothetical protein
LLSIRFSFHCFLNGVFLASAFAKFPLCGFSQRFSDSDGGLLQSANF